jgi:hypothetical protein
MSAKTNTSSQNRSVSRDDTQEVSGFYDFHARGCGYMSRVRWVSPRQGRRNNEFLACAINAVHGSVDDPNYSYMDLIVSGDEAKELVAQLEDASNKKRKIFVSFVVGDIWAHAYTRPAKDGKGRETGEEEINAIIKGRLLLLTYVKIDDQVFYQREQNAELDNEETDAAGALSDESTQEDGDHTGADTDSGQFDGEAVEDAPQEEVAPRQRKVREPKQASRPVIPPTQARGKSGNRPSRAL